MALCRMGERKNLHVVGEEKFKTILRLQADDQELFPRVQISAKA